MSYCDFCSRLVELMVTPCPLGAKVSTINNDVRVHRVEIEDTSDSKDSVQKCMLCPLLDQGLRDKYGEDTSGRDVERRVREGPYTLFLHYNARVWNPSCDSCLVNCSLRERSYRMRRIELGVWTQEGTLAATTISTRPPILKSRDEIDETCNLVRDWLHHCATSHGDCERDCNESIFDVELPTRCIYVKVDGNDDSVRLAQTQGIRGAYCALSHCWGPVDKQPIRTLESNIKDHNDGISLNTLPRTFREAVILTRGLGIDYLWIDSLCIIQDSEEDWQHEAALMGSLYKSATLVIAAAGSPDPTGGLFICERPASEGAVAQLSHPQDGSIFNVALLPTNSLQRDIRPAYGPLRERGWAFQEWILPQRKVFFMPGGFTWSCQTLDANDKGTDADLGVYDQSWFERLGQYSGCKFTQPSDRLIAFQGIVQEEGEKGDDRFLSEGVWEEDISRHLSWFREQENSHLFRDSPALPSWSWASTAGKKVWVSEYLTHDYGCVATNAPHGGCLHMSGRLARLNIEMTEVRHWCVGKIRHDISDFIPEIHMIGDGAGSLLRIGVTGSVVGLAVFDKTYDSNTTDPDGDFTMGSSTPVPSLFWSLGKTLRHPHDPCYGTLSESDDAQSDPGVEKTHSSEPHNPEQPDSSSDSEHTNSSKHSDSDDAENDSEVQATHSSEPHNPEQPDRSSDCPSDSESSNSSGYSNSSKISTSNLHHHHDDCVDFRQVGRSSHVFWALILEPVTGVDETYKRVGLAMLYPWAVTADDIVSTSVILV